MDGTYARRESLDRYDLFRCKTPLLGELDIELTERCNNRCVHCYINRPERDSDASEREMDTGFLRDLLEQAAALGCLEVRFTGGEPLLRDDFAEVYCAARGLGMRVTLFTNARLVTPTIASLLSRIPPGRAVEVSVYGMRPESYDAVAGVPGAFCEFRRGVDLLSARKVPFVLKRPLLPQNRGETILYETWAASIGCGGERSRTDVIFDLRARRDDPATSDRIRHLRPSPEDAVSIAARDPRYRAGLCAFCARFLGPPGHRLFTCGAGRGVAVDSYGTAQMCLALRHPDTICDLHTRSLRDVLQDVFPLLREIRARDPRYLARCARCFLRGLCEQCPAKSWMEHGTLDTPVDYFCELAHVHARQIGLIGRDERGWEIPDWEERREKILVDS